MHNIILNASIAGTLAAAALSFPTLASAQDLQLELGRDGPRMRLVEPCDPYYDDCRDSRGGDRDGYGSDRGRYERRVERYCSDDRALDKAERMGVRRAWIENAGRRIVDVRGRTRDGRRIVVSFSRAPGCPIIR